MKKYKLTEICKFIRNGVTIKQNNLSKSGYPITRIETISKGTIDNTKMGYADIFDNEKYRDWFLKKGDILISHINSESHLGKSAIYDGEDDKIIHGMNLLGVRVWKEKVDPNYLRFYFLTKNYKSQIKKIMKKSVNQASFSVNDFKEISISLPEIEIQEKIVKRLETLNFIINKRNQQLSQLELLKKSLFRSMFGEFKRENNFFFRELCQDDTKNGYKIETKYYKEFGEIQIIDQGIKEIAGYIESQKKPPYNNLPCIIFGDHTEVFKYVNERFYLGADGVKIIIPKEHIKINIIFLFHMLKNEYRILGKYERHYKYLLNLKVFLPPIELQNKFAERIEQIDKCLFEVKNSIKELETLYNSLMDKYFN